VRVARSGAVPTGEAAITAGGNLPARHVIHAVGPVYDDDPAGARDLLASAYRSSLREARNAGDRSIAFPCISTGIYGYPQDEACHVAIDAVRSDVEQHGGLDKVVFCVFGTVDRERYAKALANE
jgi:O-acetyl-ADP-ribose deacetylase (regulator of RNase III)